MKPGKELSKWKELSYHFMTEESAGDDEGEIVRHELTWRSDCK